MKLPVLTAALRVIIGLSPTFASAQTFTKITSGPVVNDGGDSRGACWVDFDADGDDDLFVSNWNQQNFLYLNNGEGIFTRVLSGPVAEDVDFYAGPAWGDYTNDGFPDLFVANGYADHLYQADGTGGFVRVTSGPVVGDSFASTIAAAWSDYDRDGDLDLLATHDNWTNSLFANNGDGSFIKITAGPVATDGGNSRGCAWGDYDNDGAPDLFVTHIYGQRNSLYHNDGDGNFTKVTAAPFGTDASASVGGSFGDYDNDGDLDLFVANGSMQPNYLYRNDGGAFTKILTGAVVTDAFDSGGSAWGDYDNDGDLDLFVANWWDNNSLFANNSDGTFTKVTQGIVVGDGGYSSAACWADYDNDGDLDLFVANNGGQSNFLYRNNGNANHWLQVLCRGVGSNRGGVGVKVRVRAALAGVPTWQLREISTQTGASSASAPRAAFGLGDAAIVDSLRIEWPSGIVQVLTGVAPNQILEITETTSAPTANFYAAVTEGLAPLSVQFTSTSMPGASPITSWSWDLDGDGAVDSSVENPLHVYTSRGLYSVRLVVSDGAAADTLLMEDYVRVYEPDQLSGRLFYTWRIYPATGPASGAALARMDADNLPDLVTLSGVLPSVVSIRPNLGNGTFGSASTYNFSTDSGRLEVADLNGDGRQDVTVLNMMGSTSVLVRLGTPNGLGALATYPDGSWLQDMELADLSGDGRPDVIYCNYTGSSRLSFRINLGNGNFGVRQDIALAHLVYSLGAGDLNGDGFDDVVATTWESPGQTLVFMNDGAGQLQAPYTIEHAGGQAVVEIADMNGDLAPEVIVAGGTTKIHWNSGAGLFPTVTTLSDPTTSSDVEVGDIDGDGRPDLVMNGWDDVAVLLYRGGVSFGSVKRYETAETGTALALSDFDLDGDLDIAQASRGGRGVYLRDNLGGGLFQNNHTFPDLRGYQLCVADFDQDGDPDLASTSSERAYAAFYNGDGTFAPQQTLSEPVNSWGVRGANAGRIDGDAYPDLVVTLHDWYRILGFTTFQSQGDGTFGPSQEWGITSCGPGESTIADLNGDGFGDVVVANGAGGCPSSPELFRSLSISLNQGGAGFGAAFLIDAGGGGPLAVAAEDVDLDGDLDLLTPLSGDDALSVLLNDGTGTSYAGPFLYPTGAVPSNLTVADLNADGYPDVAVCNAGIPDQSVAPTMSVFSNSANGSGQFDSGTLYPRRGNGPSQDSYYVTAADADHDGDLDLLVPSWTKADFSVYPNEGDGTFTEAEIYGAGKNLEEIAFADFSGDGCPDVVFGFGGSIGLARGLTCSSVDVNEPRPRAEDRPPTLMVRGFPNPSDGAVDLVYSLPSRGDLRLRVFDVAGRLVRSFKRGPATASEGSVRWDGRDEAGRPTPPGIYFLQAESSGASRTVKIARIR